MEELKIKAQKIKLIAFDVDGVLTDGGISYTDNGVEIKTFNAKDGQGMSMLADSGYVTAIITARTSEIVARRARDLKVTEVYQGAKNKLIAFQELLEKYNLSAEEVAYVGDDFPDICILSQVGLACCPADAVDEVKNICHFIADKEGGKGAVRQIANLILSSSGQLERFLAHKALAQ
jgi:3-deoxy-D-manno-octulosonate 8-phosphate phosphatase (KDO 8-P phosphatase)